MFAPAGVATVLLPITAPPAAASAGLSTDPGPTTATASTAVRSILDDA